MASKDLNIIIKATDRASKEIKDIGNNLSNFAERNKKTFQKMAGVGTAAFVGISAGIMKFTSDLGKNADRLLDLNAITGISTKSLQEYTHVTRAAGVNSEALTNAASILTKRFNSLEDEGSRANETAAKLGVSLRDSTGEMRNMDNILMDSLKALGKVGNETERNAMANELFGRSYEDLIPIMALGGDEIERLREEANKMGLVMSEDALNSANELRVAQENLTASVGAVKTQIASALIPVVLELVEKIQPVITNIVNWISKNPPLTATIIKVSLAVAGVVSVLGTLGLVLGPILKLLGVLKFVIAALGGPIIAIIAVTGLLVTAMINDWGGIRTAIENATDWVFHRFQELKDWLDKTIPVALDFLGAKWKGVLEWVKGVTDGIIGGIVDRFDKLRSTVEGVVGFATKQAERVGNIVGGARDVAGGAVGAVGGAVQSVGGFFGMRALGGPVQANKPYLVGENGPELFMPNSSGRIKNETGGQAIININMGGVTVNNEADENRLVAKIKETLIRDTKLYNLGIA